MPEAYAIAEPLRRGFPYNHNVEPIDVDLARANEGDITESIRLEAVVELPGVEARAPCGPFEP